MVWIPGLRYLLGWERLPLFGHYDYVEMTRFLTMYVLSYACHQPVHNYTPFVVASSVGETSKVSTRLEDMESDIFF
jgi:hypothetical protein